MPGARAAPPRYSKTTASPVQPDGKASDSRRYPAPPPDLSEPLPRPDPGVPDASLLPDSGPHTHTRTHTLRGRLAAVARAEARRRLARDRYRLDVPQGRAEGSLARAGRHRLRGAGGDPGQGV